MEDGPRGGCVGGAGDVEDGGEGWGDRGRRDGYLLIGYKGMVGPRLGGGNVRAQTTTLINFT